MESLTTIKQPVLVTQYETVCTNVLGSLEVCVNNLVTSEAQLAKLRREVSSLQRALAPVPMEVEDESTQEQKPNGNGTGPSGEKQAILIDLSE